MDDELDLGCFSMSLNVADLDRSLEFYAALGFRVIGGEERWRILSNGPTKIGLFEGVIDENTLTFNPGIAQEWDGPEGVTEAAGPGAGPGMPQPLPSFTDVREIERHLAEAGIAVTRSTSSDSGPDHITLVDPDGNQILIDQFF
jgi:lactoylglutathione lyase